MVLYDVETKEIVVPPYVLVFKEEKKIPVMNLETYNERIRSEVDWEHEPRIFILCYLEVVDENNRCYKVGEILLPKKLFPETFNFFNRLERITIN